MDLETLTVAVLCLADDFVHDLCREDVGCASAARRRSSPTARC